MCAESESEESSSTSLLSPESETSFSSYLCVGESANVSERRYVSSDLLDCSLLSVREDVSESLLCFSSVMSYDML